MGIKMMNEQRPESCYWRKIGSFNFNGSCRGCIFSFMPEGYDGGCSLPEHYRLGRDKYDLLRKRVKEIERTSKFESKVI